jgi:MtN3 and saliva related transmembrane protein
MDDPGPDVVAPPIEEPRSLLERLYPRYMLVVGIGGNLFFYIQAWRIFSIKDATAVSLTAQFVIFWAVVSWFGYGLLLKDKVLIAANVVAIVGALLVIAGKLIY